MSLGQIYANHGIKMASVRRVDERWRAEVRQKGKYASKSFSTRAAAKRWAAGVETETEQPAGTGSNSEFGATLRSWSELPVVALAAGPRS